MGGDLGLYEVVEAVRLVLTSFAEVEAILLIGQEPVLAPLISAAGLKGHPKVSVIHAEEVITMTDKPLKALKAKKDASMIRMIEFVKNGEVGAAVSSGNTGALMASSTLQLDMIDGIERPALSAVVPRKGGYFILIDAGANPEAHAKHLVHNAILGANYAKVIFDVSKPRVGLLTIGTEEGKGNQLTADTHRLLKKISPAIIEYQGPIEGFEIFFGGVDVVICDGFVGNILLKSWESLANFMNSILKTELKKNLVRRAGAALAKGALNHLKAHMNPDLYAGAPLLGVCGNILKVHGSSNRYAWANAIRAANKVIRQNLYHRIETDVAKANFLTTPLVSVRPTSANV